LHLSSFELHNLADVDLPPTLAELDLTSNRLISVDRRLVDLHLQVPRYNFYKFLLCIFICVYEVLNTVCLFHVLIQEIFLFL
jgi:hypothetical protein